MSNTYAGQRQESSLFAGSSNEFDQETGDLYYSHMVDDIAVQLERIKLGRESLPYVNEAMVVADELVLEVMKEFYDDGDDFHPHSDVELRQFLYEQMRAQISRELGWKAVRVATDAWLSARLAHIHGFPPYHYEEE